MALNGLILERVWAGEQDLEKIANLVGLESFFFLLAIAFLYFFLTTISRYILYSTSRKLLNILLIKSNLKKYEIKTKKANVY
jgi:hypothetical protein